MQKLYRAFFPPSCTIAGYRLRPFCAGHLLALEAIGSPFVTGGATDVGDLQAALKICTGRHPFDYDLRPNFRDVWRRLWIGPARASRLRFSFRLYVGTNTMYPDFFEDKNGLKLGGVSAPSILPLMCGLVELGYGERTAWEMSLGRAAWIEATHSQRIGRSSRKFFDRERVAEAVADAKKSAPDFGSMTREERYQFILANGGKVAADRWLGAQVAAAN